MYTHILIDLDHTLLDSDASEAAAFGETLRAAGVADPDAHLAAFQTINRALWAAVERHEMTPDHVRVARFEELAKVIAEDADPEEMADRYVAGLSQFGDLYPAARRVLPELSNKATLALVTNGIGEVQRARIDRLALGSYFAAIVVSGEVGVAKPAPEIFDIVFQQLGQPAKSSTAMVGDSLSSDIRGGANYGISTCWFNPSGRKPGPENRFDHEISDLGQLLALVGP